MKAMTLRNRKSVTMSQRRVKKTKLGVHHRRPQEAFWEVDRTVSILMLYVGMLKRRG